MNYIHDRKWEKDQKAKEQGITALDWSNVNKNMSDFIRFMDKVVLECAKIVSKIGKITKYEVESIVRSSK